MLSLSHSLFFSPIIMPTYSESAKDLRISKTRAMKEIKDHCCDMAEFLCEMGDHE